MILPKSCLVFLAILICINFSVYGQARHQAKVITGSTNNQLEVLDWGGKGQSILFLTGLGNSAHVYDDFAKRFTHDFRVYGMSRRGYGASEQTITGFGIDTLSNDILAVINALGIKKVVLIGHSIAGNEITTFATKYPDRVAKVVYLDAAYDHSNLGQLSFPRFPPVTATDSASMQNFNKYLKRVRGFMFPAEELKNQYEFTATGALGKAKTPPTITNAIIKGVRVPNYKAIKSPALAIYGQRNTAQQWFASYPYMDAANQKKAVTEFMPAWKKYYTKEVSRFRNEIPNGIVAEIPAADHYIYLTHPDRTEKLIRDFLK